ncbi:hypothetical protein ACTQ50_17730, partial [Blautia sp. Sow4_E7]|uniref:hypothetical protein n=1 Tax=Blautia sp. Sow4_E7 TaxID=3438749 RepID=UPI003F912B51
EHSQIFVDFEKNKKKRSFKRKMVLGITPNTKFVYSLNAAQHEPHFLIHCEDPVKSRLLRVLYCSAAGCYGKTEG